MLADMRSFALGRKFALVIVSCNSLADLTTNDDLKACFSRIREHLRPGVIVAFDIVNPDVTSLARSVSEVVCLERLLGCREISVRETANYDPVTRITICDADQNRDLARTAWRTACPHPGAPLPATDLSSGVAVAARSGGAEADGPLR